MKCSFCGKDYSYDSVKRKYGTIHYAEYGCCSEDCYKGLMSGAPKPPPPTEEAK